MEILKKIMKKVSYDFNKFCKTIKVIRKHYKDFYYDSEDTDLVIEDYFQYCQDDALEYYKKYSSLSESSKKDIDYAKSQAYKFKSKLKEKSNELEKVKERLDSIVEVVCGDSAKEIYEQLDKNYDVDQFRQQEAAEEILGSKATNMFYAEDNMGYFEDHGSVAIKFIESYLFDAYDYEYQNGYEVMILKDLDKSTDDFKDYELRKYKKAIRNIIISENKAINEIMKAA